LIPYESDFIRMQLKKNNYLHQLGVVLYYTGVVRGRNGREYTVTLTNRVLTITEYMDAISPIIYYPYNSKNVESLIQMRKCMAKGRIEDEVPGVLSRLGYEEVLKEERIIKKYLSTRLNNI